MIEAYKFGEIKVRGKIYQNDVIIYPDHVNSQWWRKESHSLDIDDIREVIAAKPEVIVFGTGQPGLMKVTSKTVNTINDMDIETIIMPTEHACKEYNKIELQKKVIACIHLTC
ncbi:MAG: MTH938/NDUFAF3 family protein [candidate division WOR-3 bacterium]|nr:MTH938/NDUFAF3 family protein [candidate division WOR-3 bacterium]